MVPLAHDSPTAWLHTEQARGLPPLRPASEANSEEACSERLLHKRRAQALLARSVTARDLARQLEENADMTAFVKELRPHARVALNEALELATTQPEGPLPSPIRPSTYSPSSPTMSPAWH